MDEGLRLDVTTRTRKSCPLPCSRRHSAETWQRSALAAPSSMRGSRCVATAECRRTCREQPRSMGKRRAAMSQRGAEVRREVGREGRGVDGRVGVGQGLEDALGRESSQTLNTHPTLSTARPAPYEFRCTRNITTGSACVLALCVLSVLSSYRSCAAPSCLECLEWSAWAELPKGLMEQRLQKFISFATKIPIQIPREFWGTPIGGLRPATVTLGCMWACRRGSQCT